MGILLAFAPFIAFALIDRIVGPTEGLVAGTLVSLALLARDVLAPERTPKILEIGTAILFGGLAAYALIATPSWSVIGVRLCVDAGLLMIVVLSLALGRPFTLQYAREQVPRAYWDSPQFVRTNVVISSVWALAFAAMVLAELALLTVPTLSHRVGIAVIVAALVGAWKFTAWYPERVRRGSGA